MRESSQSRGPERWVGAAERQCHGKLWPQCEVTSGARSSECEYVSYSSRHFCLAYKRLPVAASAAYNSELCEISKSPTDGRFSLHRIATTTADDNHSLVRTLKDSGTHSYPTHQALRSAAMTLRTSVQLFRMRSSQYIREVL